MLPYLIAGAIGFGIGKLFENGGETFMAGGRITTNEGIIESFLNSNREVRVGNLESVEMDDIMYLRNYRTFIAKRMGDKVKISSQKYSQTTSTITNRLKALAEKMGYSVEYVTEKEIYNFDEFVGGGEIKLKIKNVDSFDKHYDEVGFTKKELSLPKQDSNKVWFTTTNDNSIAEQLISDGFVEKYTNGGEINWNGEDFDYWYSVATEDSNESKKELNKLSKKDSVNYDDVTELALSVRDDINDIGDFYDYDEDEWVDNDAMQMCYAIAEKMLEQAGVKVKYANGGETFMAGGKADSWSVSDLSNAKYLGIIEFQDNEGEYHNFEIMETDDRLVFGGMTNTGFIESGYIEKDGFSTDETLQSLIEDLEVYYNDGAEYTSQIVFNERMENGGEVELETWRENGVSENEKMDFNKLTRSEVKDILKELGYNVTEYNFSKFHKKEHFDYIKEKDVFYRNDVNDNYAGGGLPKKRRRSASIQYGRSDTAVDKTRVGKPVGYRFSNAKANQLRKDPYAKPTEAQVKKYLGKGIYKENRKNRSDRDKNVKL